ASSAEASIAAPARPAAGGARDPWAPQRGNGAHIDRLARGYGCALCSLLGHDDDRAGGHVRHAHGNAAGYGPRDDPETARSADDDVCRSSLGGPCNLTGRTVT